MTLSVMRDISDRKRLQERLEGGGANPDAGTERQVRRLQDETTRRVLAETGCGNTPRCSTVLPRYDHAAGVSGSAFQLCPGQRSLCPGGRQGPDYFIGKNHFALYPHEENQAIFEQTVRRRRPIMPTPGRSRIPISPSGE